ncbi:hypothetical protein EJ08DRAFT_680230 [Tothia fuscella]|uniref:Uncharacterized protein n=1 Tax=Tothia fuscella TaxID=1048955 RepID=A0A9P4NNH4_9PEZI|nr:hypothetical protein EJ08DRAFT_680230 [Tothia fuscella]
MKLKVLFLVTAWTLSASASPLLEKRQSTNALADLVAKLPPSSIIAPFKVEEVKPQLRTTATRKIIRYGPFKLPANTGSPKPAKGEMSGHSHGESGSPGASPKVINPLDILTGQKPMDPNGFSQMRVLKDGVMCSNCTVLAGKMDIVFENGTRADISGGVYLHHVITIDLTKQRKAWLTGCSGALGSSPAAKPNVPGGAGAPGGGLNTFIGGAVDAFVQYYTTPDGKFNSGYFIDNNKFMMQVEMINYRPDEQTVYISTDLEYIDGHVGGDATQGVLSATGCGAAPSNWKPAKNTAGKVMADGFNVLRNGHIISLRGHLHDGGTSVSLYVNNQLKCTSTAVYGGEGGKLTIEGKSWETISKMTECSEPIEVKAGDTIKVEGTYDTKAHPLRESQGEEQEAMAIMSTMFVPSASTEIR